MTAEQEIRLASREIRNLRRSAYAQAVIFGLLAMTFGCCGLTMGFVAIDEGASPGLVVGMGAISVVFLVVGALFLWLAVATMLFGRRMDRVTVNWYEGVPVKKVFLYRRSANIGAGMTSLTSSRLSGAWLCHDGKKFAVDLDLFRRIPDEGVFRFLYIRRPGLPGLLTPLQIVDFAPVAQTGSSGAHAESRKGSSPACNCMTPGLKSEGYETIHVGVDETNGRFGDVFVDTCRDCGRKWLRYHVEYEAFEKSGRWFRGLPADELLRTLSPEGAVAALEGLDWYFAGGSYFDSAGFKTSGPLALDP